MKDKKMIKKETTLEKHHKMLLNFSLLLTLDYDGDL
jgi:hypothetical protein